VEDTKGPVVALPRHGPRHTDHLASVASEGDVQLHLALGTMQVWVEPGLTASE
jgi:hypothetical protein